MIYDLKVIKQRKLQDSKEEWYDQAYHNTKKLFLNTIFHKRIFIYAFNLITSILGLYNPIYFSW